MLASLLFEPCSSSPGHLRLCAPCCVGHAESQPYARSDTAPVVCALRVLLSPVFRFPRELASSAVAVGKVVTPSQPQLESGRRAPERQPVPLLPW